MFNTSGEMNTNELHEHAAFLEWAQHRVVSEWGLRLGARLTGGHSGAWLYACVDEAGAKLVLKLSPPDECAGGLARAASSALEAAALRVWHGRGVATFRAFDDVTGALLLERIVPGTHLPQSDPEEGWGFAAEVLALLHGVGVDPAWEFPNLAD